ncbi:hypothetical protein HZA97_06345 [Candidatus Woesearchaeota archaeon]|nr:hypothetical protein [Candidatus Woesearchaeota archaeon]
MNEKIQVSAIIEMLGGPKEYIESTLRKYIEKIKKDGTDIKTEVYHEGVSRETLFSTFVELEVHFNEVDDLLDFCFESMPSSIEIMHPESITLHSNILTDFFNDLQAKIHQNDMLVKNYRAQNKVLDNNAMNVFRNFLLFLVKQNPLTAEEASKNVGINAEQLSPFFDKLVEEGKIRKEGDKYVYSKRVEERS